MRNVAIWIFGMIFLGILLIAVDSRSRSSADQSTPGAEDVWLSSSAFALLSAGNSQLMADYLWIDAVQFLGKTMARHSHKVVDGEIVCMGIPREQVEDATEKYYRLVTRVTEVDPHFTYAYYLGALFLNDPHADPDMAIELLESGVNRNPKNWFLRFWYAFLTLFVQKDREAAKAELDIAASLDGCPDYVNRIRERLATATEQDLAKLFLKASLQKTRSDLERDRLLRQLEELDAGVDIRLIQQLRESHHDHDHNHGHD